MARTETVTVVFSDLVGSTTLASQLGHDAYEVLRQEYFAACCAVIATHHGTEIKSTGDGLMVSFTSAADAVACGVALQQATDGAGRRARTEPVWIRVGVSSGEATREATDLYGPPVVEASRLCAAAAGGTDPRLRCRAGALPRQGPHLHVGWRPHVERAVRAGSGL